MYIYVASPYSLGDKLQNVEASLRVADQLLERGHVPFAPLLSHYWDLVSPKDYETWLALDMCWIRRCDALLRVPGASSGADREVAYARQLGIPVFMSIDEVPDLNSELRGDECHGSRIQE